MAWGSMIVSINEKYNVRRYSWAAEMATGEGKGKLAMKLGMLAEEAWGEMPEEAGEGAL